ncbi:bifunctional oligoribonuclease/PAP phosphatase NrnA [Defluviitalea saccharophila]|uniref:Bifunctional oligoribonuclease/PAP phosphatase NrnA n=1 Tax=Defluviitalea saccharophila TaxID=879970 RepID=A0ABZ2Y8E8_9FIRM|nr:bifunctional oligoribonuclease/PAP phosphatase NrnA [Candidatus Epulonipiscium sp.]
MNAFDIIQSLKKYTHIALAAHISPDGDAIGACTALALALAKINKKPIILMEEYLEKYNFLPGRQYIYNTYPADEPLELFVALDCGDLQRLGAYAEYFEKAPLTINIDHHISNPNYGDYNYVDSEASSTCEIIYKIIKQSEINIDDEIAASLYTGIVFDTGGFKHSNTTALTHQIISDLIKYNIEFSDIMDRLFYSRSIESAKLLGLALNKMELLQDKQLCVCDLSKKEMEEVGASVNDTEGIISSMKNIEGVLVAILLYEKNSNEVKVSFRASGDKDVCKIAQIFQGGGHKKAAGCSLNTDLIDAKKKILDIVQKELF